MKIRLAFVGGGGHARSIIDSLDFDLYEVIGVYDDNTIMTEFKHLGNVNQVLHDANLDVFDKLFVSIGSNEHRSNVLTQIESIGEKYFINLIAPSAYISHSSEFNGNNIFIGQFSYIGPNTKIGHNSMVNTGSILEHDSILEEHSSLATRVVVNGMCLIGSHTSISTGVVVIEGITIGDDIVVGAGATVVNNLKESGTYLGTPAKIR